MGGGNLFVCFFNHLFFFFPLPQRGLVLIIGKTSLGALQPELLGYFAVENQEREGEKGGGQEKKINCEKKGKGGKGGRAAQEKRQKACWLPYF